MLPVSSEIASQLLITLESFEKSFEVSLAKATCSFAFNRLKEDGWATAYRFRKDLEQIALIVVVNQDTKLSNLVDILIYVTNAIQYMIIVSRGSRQEIDPTLLQVAYRRYNIIGIQCNVLNPRAIVEVEVLFYLRLATTQCRFINRKLNTATAILHHL